MLSSAIAISCNFFFHNSCAPSLSLFGPLTHSERGYFCE